VINYDMQLPRPYSNRWLLEGTLGVYDEEKASIYLTDKSPEYHTWEHGNHMKSNTIINGGRLIFHPSLMVEPIMSCWYNSQMPSRQKGLLRLMFMILQL
jgi:hypothetical protein